MRITYSQRRMPLEVDSNGIPPSNNHHSELQLTIRRQIRMLNYWVIEIIILVNGQAKSKEVHMHWLHIITQIFREQEMQTNINTSNIKISTLKGTIFISPTTDQRDQPTAQYGTKIENKKRHLVKSINSWHHIIEYLLEKASIQWLCCRFQVHSLLRCFQSSIQA